MTHVGSLAAAALILLLESAVPTRSPSFVTVDFSPDGKHLVTGGLGLPVRVWDAATGKEEKRITPKSAWASRAIYTPDGKLLVVGDENSKTRLVAPGGGTPDDVLGESGPALVPWATLSRDGGLAALPVGNHDVAIWNFALSKSLRRVDVPDAIWSAGFSPDGKQLAVLSYDHHVRVWSLDTGKQAFEINTREQCYSMAISPDGKTIACGADAGIITFWNAADGTYRYTVSHPGSILGLAYSPDGKLLASHSGDGTTRIWDAADGRLRRRLAGGASTLVFSPDGTRLAAGGDHDKRSVWIWEAGSGKELLQIDLR